MTQATVILKPLGYGKGGYAGAGYKFVGNPHGRTNFALMPDKAK